MKTKYIYLYSQLNADKNKTIVQKQTCVNKRTVINKSNAER